MTNYTQSSIDSTNYGPEQDTSSIYDSATDDFDGTDLATTATDLTYDGIVLIEGGSTNYAADNGSNKPILTVNYTVPPKGIIMF